MTRRPCCTDSSGELTDHRDRHTVQEGLDVKQERGLYTWHSAAAKVKEQAMHQRFLERLEAGLQKLDSAMRTGHLREEGLANRRLGRLLEKNVGAGGVFDVVSSLPQQMEKLGSRSHGNATRLGMNGHVLRMAATSCEVTCATSIR